MADKDFPLLSDLDPIFEEREYLNLYDDQDLISNIKGDYQDKAIYDWSPISKRQHSDSENEAKDNFKTDAALGREEARESVRKKRSASYLQDNPGQTFRKELQRRAMHKESPVSKSDRTSDYSRYSQNLRQDYYILAARPGAARKNSRKLQEKDSYDFLRKSQIYQNKEREAAQMPVNQELDLRKLSEKKEKE